MRPLRFVELTGKREALEIEVRSLTAGIARCTDQDEMSELEEALREARYDLGYVRWLLGETLGSREED